MGQRIALVTGGTGGLGTAVCEFMTDSGYQVVATYSRKEKQTDAELWQAGQREQGRTIGLVHMDIASYESCHAAAEVIQTQYGTVSVLVNNAGVTRDAAMKKMSYEQWNDVLRTNLDGMFNVTKQFLDGMLEQGYGRIINISSVNGQRGQFGQVNYAASKAGIHGFTKALALEVAAKGITVNTVSPGAIATKMLLQMDPAVLDKIVSPIPVKRLAAPLEIARVVGFLADEQSGYITGSNLSINGGLHLY